MSFSDNSNITEIGPQHFIVSNSGKITEVFLTDSKSLSDGNALDGIEVNIPTERERLISERFKNISSGKGTGSSKGSILKAPMPGMVRSVSVSAGDKVQKNTQVIVLEAMKMENSITAGFEGIVSKVLVQSGVSVEKNEAMIEFSN
jgi:biotin carboxyl carrier protein